ncbi:MAG: IS5 family transposase [Phycisphaeraceae bacterium]|nr:IS5 family transposase [Phycisphaeraceae bacterium]
MADEVLAAMSRTLTAAYATRSEGGRRSAPPERLLKALLLMSLYSIRSERALCERITFDMLFRWFLDMTPDEPCFDHSTFSVNRERLRRLKVTEKFSDRIVLMAYEAGLRTEDHFSIDGSPLQTHASLQSLKHIEQLRQSAAEQSDQDGPETGAGSGPKDGNAWVNFRGEKRSNRTHRSGTDPEARLYTKTSGVAYLQHMMHVVTENRHGIGVAIMASRADGYAERKSYVRLVDRVRRRMGIRPRTLGTDKGYDCAELLHALEERGVRPHVASRLTKKMRTEADDDPALHARRRNQARRSHPSVAVSQRKRRLTEEVLGWMKQVGGLRRARVSGRWTIQQLAEIALSALNLLRVARLQAT